jgi:hypothetical protein
MSSAVENRFLFPRMDVVVRGTAVGSILLLLLLGIASLPGSAFAEEPNRAALVVQFDHDRVETRCVSFEGSTITGGEMLQRSGLDVIIDSTRGMGITLCKVGDLGCDFPAEHCFCQCMGGGPCAYWNYFYRDPGSESWVYSPLGAALHKAGPGSVEAWVWGDGHTPPADGLTFGHICAASAPIGPTGTLEPEVAPTASPPLPLAEGQSEPSSTPVTPEPTPVPSTHPSAAPQSEASPTQTVRPAATPTSQPSPDGAPGMSTYWPFGLAVLALAGIAAVARFRRQP